MPARQRKAEYDTAVLAGKNMLRVRHKSHEWSWKILHPTMQACAQIKRMYNCNLVFSTFHTRGERWAECSLQDGMLEAPMFISKEEISLLVLYFSCYSRMHWDFKLILALGKKGALCSLLLLSLLGQQNAPRPWTDGSTDRLCLKEFTGKHKVEFKSPNGKILPLLL